MTVSTLSWPSLFTHALIWFESPPAAHPSVTPRPPASVTPITTATRFPLFIPFVHASPPIVGWLARDSLVLAVTIACQVVDDPPAPY
jgi:hypothetical protein